MSSHNFPENRKNKAMSHQETVQIQFQPHWQPGFRPRGHRFIEAALEAGLDLASACGGEGNCGQCRVMVLSGNVSRLTLDEEFILSDIEQFNGRAAGLLHPS